LSFTRIKRAVICDLFLLNSLFNCQRPFRLYSQRTSPPSGRKGKLIVSLDLVNTFLHFFSMRFDVALPGGRRGKLFISLGLVNTFLQLFQLRFSASTCSEAGEASYVFSCASSTPFCNFFRCRLAVLTVQYI